MVPVTDVVFDWFSSQSVSLTEGSISLNQKSQCPFCVSDYALALQVDGVARPAFQMVLTPTSSLQGISEVSLSIDLSSGYYYLHRRFSPRFVLPDAWLNRKIYVHVSANIVGSQLVYNKEVDYFSVNFPSGVVIDARLSEDVQGSYSNWTLNGSMIVHTSDNSLFRPVVYFLSDHSYSFLNYDDQFTCQVRCSLYQPSVVPNPGFSVDEPDSSFSDLSDC